MNIDERSRGGLFAATGAYLIWGLMPVFLKLFEGISAADVLAHRVGWSAVLLALVALMTDRWRRLQEAAANPKLLGWLLFSAAMIGGNWYIYTWAVLNERVLDTSLGYFIQPMLNTALGVLLLGERLGRWHAAAVGFALLGIVIMAWTLGGLPLISLGLAGFFALYSFARNRAEVDALTGLLIETALLAPLAFWWLMSTPPGLFGEPAPLTVLLIFSSVVTSIPLGLFGYAARRLSLTTLGFLQYLAPSIVFLLAVFLYGEPLGTLKLVAFACVWAGLLLFSLGGFRARREAAKA